MTTDRKQRDEMEKVSDRYLSGWYQDHNPEWHEHRASWKAHQVLHILREQQIVPKSIIDIGCGTGGVLAELSKSIEGHLIGYEPAESALSIAKKRADAANVEFIPGTVHDICHRADVALMLDVFEHAEDYMAMIREAGQIAANVVFHIPLDVSVQSVLRRRMISQRERLGHLHYFTMETALATIRDCGYQIIAYHYTSSGFEGPGRSLKNRLFGVPRRAIVRILGADLTVRMLGGYSLCVLARPNAQ